MRSYDLLADDLNITLKLLDSVSSARKHYFKSQKERSLAKEKTSKDCQVVELNEEISKLNTDATLLKSTISDLQKSSDKALLNAQKKNKTFAEMRNEITKASALKRAATEKQEELDKTLAKKKFLLRKKFRYK